MTMRRAVLASVLLVCLSAGSALASADPGTDKQWGLHKVNAPGAWSTTRGANVTVAVVDSGVDLVHEDLRANLVGGANFVEDGAPQDDHGHGTHVAGIVGSVADNGLGVAGVSPRARIMPVRVVRRDGSGSASGSSADVSAGIRWAADHGAQVINVSLGEDVLIRTVLGPSIGDALAYAWSKGAVPVVAAGNDFLFPSGYRDVDAIIVAATDRNDNKPSYSNGIGSARWGMAAPGGSGGENGILSTFWKPGEQNTYAYLSGTSMAAPHVAGAAALLRSLGVSQQRTVDILLGTAVDVGASGRDSTFGSGRLDAAAAVRAASAPPPTAPPATAAPTRSSAPSGTQSGAGSARSVRSPDRASGAASTTSPSSDATPESGAVPTDAAAPSDDASRAAAAPRDGGRPSGGRDASPVLPAAAALGAVAAVAGGGLLVRRLRRPGV